MPIKLPSKTSSRTQPTAHNNPKRNLKKKRETLASWNQRQRLNKSWPTVKDEQIGHKLGRYRAQGLINFTAPGLEREKDSLLFNMILSPLVVLFVITVATNHFKKI